MSLIGKLAGKVADKAVDVAKDAGGALKDSVANAFGGGGPQYLIATGDGKYQRVNVVVQGEPGSNPNEHPTLAQLEKWAHNDERASGMCVSDERFAQVAASYGIELPKGYDYQSSCGCDAVAPSTSPAKTTSGQMEIS